MGVAFVVIVAVDGRYAYAVRKGNKEQVEHRHRHHRHNHNVHNQPASSTPG